MIWSLRFSGKSLVFSCIGDIISVYCHGHFAGIAQLVERHLAKVNVAGSNPVSRSR